jgi:acyl-CoA thioesterase-2
MTDNPNPTPEELVAGLLRLLDVEDLGGDRFTGRRKPGGIGRIFGGQVIGQALAAAERTVSDDRPVHSLHAYFLRGGNEDYEIDFRVERDLDGRSFSNRRIVASQLGKPILNMTASFHRLEDGVFHQDAMPDVPAPEDLPSDHAQREKFLHLIPEERRAMALRPSPIEMRSDGARHWMGSEPSEPKTASWFRCVAPLPDDPKVHRAILAYASDNSLLGTCALPHGLSWSQGTAMGASLDHAVWFHDDFRADEWLLYVTESPWAGRARGMNRGKIFSRDGRLIATVAQEGVIRKARA